jgi:tetratricopeptide (TPR) repeat protein
VRPLSFREIFAGCLIVAGLTCSLYSQAEQAPQGGGQAPAPQPTPQPQPRQPNVTPTPLPNQTPSLRIRGRIIAGPHGIDSSITQVRFETEGGQPIGFAYADSGGEFTFERDGIPFDQTVYVIVNVDGFKPHRERLFGDLRGTFDSFITIFLEPESGKSVSSKGGNIVDLKQLRARVPGKAVDEYEKALKESSRGNRAKAVEGLERAVKLAPDFYEAQHTLGIQYIAMQKYEQAEAALTKARDLSPKAAEPLINLGTLYYQRAESQSDAGRADEATATFEKAVDVLEESIRRNPLSAPAHGYLGAALYKIGSYDEAETTLKRALDLDENEYNARLMLVNVYAKSARYNEALEQTNIFLAKNPKAPQRAAMEGIKQQLEKALGK